MLCAHVLMAVVVSLTHRGTLHLAHIEYMLPFGFLGEESRPALRQREPDLQNDSVSVIWSI